MPNTIIEKLHGNSCRAITNSILGNKKIILKEKTGPVPWPTNRSERVNERLSQMFQPLQRTHIRNNGSNSCTAAIGSRASLAGADESKKGPWNITKRWWWLRVHMFGHTIARQGVGGWSFVPLGDFRILRVSRLDPPPSPHTLSPPTPRSLHRSWLIGWRVKLQTRRWTVCTWIAVSQAESHSKRSRRIRQ